MELIKEGKFEEVRALNLQALDQLVSEKESRQVLSHIAYCCFKV